MVVHKKSKTVSSSEQDFRERGESVRQRPRRYERGERTFSVLFVAVALAMIFVIVLLLVHM